MPKKRIGIIAVFIAVFLFYCGTVYAAAVNDGFDTAKRFKSHYFDISIEGGVDTEKLAMKLSIPPSLKAIIKKPTSQYHSYSLTNQLDLLYLAVCEVMDVHPRKFRCNIKIAKDASRLSLIVERLFGRPIRSGGFYALAINTLYVDAENVDINILGHEISHAVQCHYFVVPPPMKLQEVLAGFVEYQFRKYTNTLPVRRKEKRQ